MKLWHRLRGHRMVTVLRHYPSTYIEGGWTEHRCSCGKEWPL